MLYYLYRDQTRDGGNCKPANSAIKRTIKYHLPRRKIRPAISENEDLVSICKKSIQIFRKNLYYAVQTPAASKLIKNCNNDYARFKSLSLIGIKFKKTELL